MRETLFCELGKHEWSRERVRGPKPSVCPDHKPSPSTSSKHEVEEAPTPMPPKPLATATKAQERTYGFHITPLAELREKYSVDEESARVFQYVEDQINSPSWPGWREQGDINILKDAYTQRLRRIMRGQEP